MNKTTLESLEEALERLEQIDGMYSWAHLLYEVRDALAEHDLHDVRCECCGYMTHHREHMGCIRAAYAAPVSAPEQELVVDYAYATIKEYEGLVGFSVSEAFRAGWNMARTTNSMLGINAAPAQPVKQEPVISDVFFICNAYESGFGHGAKNDGLNDGSIFANKQQGEAYEFGYAEGLKRSKREPVKQEPVAWDLAEKVRRDLDRKSCPDAYMRIAMESIVKHYAAPVDAKAVRAEALEEAAKVCDDMGKTMPDRDGEITEWCAAAIRGLK